jgi:uncharacterized membrane protein YdjX (TVP38/TMEM64 family)
MSHRTVIKIVVVLMLGAVIAAVWFSPLREQLTRDNIRAFVEQLREPWYGPAVFVAVFALGCVFALPASLFVIAAGLIWGFLAGALYSIVGGLIGAVASFYVGQFVGEGLLERFGRLGAVVARQVDHAGFGTLLVLRYIPGIPFAVLNYGAGVARVRFRDFVLATLIGMTPPMFVFAWSADALFNGSLSEGDAVRRLLIVFGLMLAITLLPQLVKRLARKRLPTAG